MTDRLGIITVGPGAASASKNRAHRSRHAVPSGGQQDLVAALLHPTTLSRFTLDLVRRRAIRQGVTFDRVLIAEGHLDQDTFFRLVARALGMPFLSETFAIAPESVTPLGLRAELVALTQTPRGPRFASAPTGLALTALLREHQRTGKRKPGLAITTPKLLSESLRVSGEALTASLAADHLPREQPHHSARRLTAMAVCFRVLVFLAVGVPLALLAPEFARAFILIAIVATLGPTIALRLVASIGGRRQTPPVDLQDRDLPNYSVIIALHRERAIAGQLVSAMRNLRYPAAKLDVKFVLEYDDADTRQALEEQGLPPNFDIIVCPKGHPRTKPRALNAALAFCRGDLIAIYDAEDIPDPEQLHKAAAAFAAGTDTVACYQARLVIDNVDDSWLTQQFALEYAVLFDRILPGLARLGLPIPLGGTSNHFRPSALEHALGWDAWNVTEDADLGLRLARLGYHIGHLPSDTIEEAPATFGLWFRQRRRWLKGWMQTSFVHLSSPRALIAELGWMRAGVLGVHTAGTVMSALLAPWTIIWLGLLASRFGDLIMAGKPLDWSWTDLIGVLLAGGGVAAIIVPALSVASQRGLRLGAATLLRVPAYVCLISLAAWAALLDFCIAPTHWHKTDHGLARTSRSGAPIMGRHRMKRST